MKVKRMKIGTWNDLSSVNPQYNEKVCNDLEHRKCTLCIVTEGTTIFRVLLALTSAVAALEILKPRAFRTLKLVAPSEVVPKL